MLVWVCLSVSHARCLVLSLLPPVPSPHRSSTPLDFGTLDFAPVAVDLAAFVPLTFVLFLIFILCDISFLFYPAVCVYGILLSVCYSAINSVGLRTVLISIVALSIGFHIIKTIRCYSPDSLRVLPDIVSHQLNYPYFRHSALPIALL